MHAKPALTAALIAAALAGCVTDPSPSPDPICTVDTDCMSGQTCRDHQCFGGNTGAEFAAELFAPTARTDMLARAEVKRLDVTEAGDVEIMFANSIEISGRVLLRNTDTVSTAATLVFRRPSRIPGASPYVVQVDALPGKYANEVAFKARITPNEAGEDGYELSIYPDDGSLQTPPAGAPKPTSLAPPTANLFKLTEDWKADFTLDKGGLKKLSGYVTNAVGNGLDNMQVRAYRKRSAMAVSELVSSTAVTANGGRYDLYVPLTDATTLDLVVTPGPNIRMPSLTRKGVEVPETTSVTTAAELPFLMYPALPGIVRYLLPVVGPDGSGGRSAVVSATVIATTALTPGTVGDTVTYATEASVNAAGLAELYLVPGAADKNRNYKITVIPPPNATQGTRWDAPLAVGPGTGEGGMLPQLEVPSRLLVTGRLVDADGIPADKVGVRPTFAGSFTTGLSVEAQERLKAVNPLSVTTDEKGMFNLYLDTTVMGLAPVYDFELVPPSASRLPRWSRDGVRLADVGDGGKLTLSDTVLPKTTLATGTVRDEDGNAVPDAEVHVYMRDGGPGARLRTLTKSDKDGHVVLILPSP